MVRNGTAVPQTVSAFPEQKAGSLPSTRRRATLSSDLFNERLVITAVLIERRSTRVRATTPPDSSSARVSASNQRFIWLDAYSPAAGCVQASGTHCERAGRTQIEGRYTRGAPLAPAEWKNSSGSIASHDSHPVVSSRDAPRGRYRSPLSCVLSLRRDDGVVACRDEDADGRRGSAARQHGFGFDTAANGSATPELKQRISAFRRARLVFRAAIRPTQ